jgi:hypothetical protein
VVQPALFFDEPFHRAGGVHGLSGLRFAALLGGLCEPAEQLKDVVVMNSCTALRWAVSRRYGVPE